MAGRRIQFPADSISMSAALADGLIKKGSGDAALLCLYLLRHDGYYDPEEAGRALQWERSRLDGAMTHLGELGIQTGEPRPQFRNEIPEEGEAPEYSQNDLVQALNMDNDFAQLHEMVREKFGVAVLPDRDLKILLELYSHLGMPFEVLIYVIEHQCAEYRKKYKDPRRVPPMSYIRKAAYRWKRSGIDTLEAADSYLKRLEYYESQEGTMLNAVSIFGREAMAFEKEYIAQWLDWGFGPEAVTLAFEQTMKNCGMLKWKYLNGVLRNWHNAGLHTVKEIKEKDIPRRPAKTGAASMAPAPARQLTNAEQEARDRAYEENQRQARELLEMMRKE